MSFVLKNSYSTPSSSNNTGKPLQSLKTLQSLEGTALEEPIAVALFGVVNRHFLGLVHNLHVSQKKYANDSSGVGPLEGLLLFSKQLIVVVTLTTP